MSKVAVVALALVGLAAGGSAATCARQRMDKAKESGVPASSIEAVLQRHGDQLMMLPGVVGTGIGECPPGRQPCIKLFVARTTPELLRRVPATLEGFPVAVEETGEIRALDSSR